MGERPVLLLVDDDERAHQVLRRRLVDRWHVREAYDVPEALAALDALAAEGTGLTAAIIDYKMPGGSGLQVLAAARDRYPEAFLVLLTGYFEPDTVARCFALGGHYLFKLDTLELFDMLAHRLLAGARDPSPALMRAVGAVTAELGLAPTEAEVLLLASAGLTRPAIARRLGISESTLKSHIASILFRTADTMPEVERLADLVKRVRERAGFDAG